MLSILRLPEGNCNPQKTPSFCIVSSFKIFHWFAACQQDKPLTSVVRLTINWINNFLQRSKVPELFPLPNSCVWKKAWKCERWIWSDFKMNAKFCCCRYLSSTESILQSTRWTIKVISWTRWWNLVRFIIFLRKQPFTRNRYALTRQDNSQTLWVSFLFKKSFGYHVKREWHSLLIFIRLIQISGANITEMRSRPLKTFQPE